MVTNKVSILLTKFTKGTTKIPRLFFSGVDSVREKHMLKETVILGKVTQCIVNII